ncbi:MAG TPA: glycosyltransferase family 2 protein [Opitutales bacterium]|nr:glycosyltransferase family 2 protein [Opitutales bacterium]
MERLSIITALHNCVDLTRAYVDSLLETVDYPDWELILVDDASTDSTPEFLDSIRSRFTVLHNPGNMGYARSNNRGESVATGSILAFLNNDLTLSKGWLDPMLHTLYHAPKAGAVGNIQINPRTGLIDHAGVFFGLDGMPRQARKNRAAFPATPTTEWNAVTAACMLMKRSVFVEAGRFDEAYRNGFEDIDLCVKLRTMGFQHYVCNNSRIYHHVSQSPGRHHHNSANEVLFRDRWASVTSEWGAQEWPSEYLKRYARHWWKLNLNKTLRAIVALTSDREHRLIHRP